MKDPIKELQATIKRLEKAKLTKEQVQLLALIHTLLQMNEQLNLKLAEEQLKVKFYEKKYGNN